MVTTRSQAQKQGAPRWDGLNINYGPTINKSMSRWPNSNAPRPGFRFGEYNLPSGLQNEKVLHKVFTSVDAYNTQLAGFANYYRANEDHVREHQEHHNANHHLWALQPQPSVPQEMNAIHMGNLRAQRNFVKRVERRENAVRHGRRMRWNPFVPTPVRAAPVRRSNRWRGPVQIYN